MLSDHDDTQAGPSVLIIANHVPLMHSGYPLFLAGIIADLPFGKFQFDPVRSLILRRRISILAAYGMGQDMERLAHTSKERLGSVCLV